LNSVCVPEESTVGNKTLICNSKVEEHTSKYASIKCPTNEYHFLKCLQVRQNSPFTDCTEIYKKLLDAVLGDFVEICSFNWRPAISSVAFQKLRLRVLLQGTLSVVLMVCANDGGIFYNNLRQSIILRDSFYSSQTFSHTRSILPVLE